MPVSRRFFVRRKRRCLSLRTRFQFTLALLRMMFGGLAVLGAVIFGFGALSVWFYQAWVRARLTSTAG